ncbi:MAG TPA: tetratricopeptide repeat protein, partial [Kofleriaceae bacterium]|nr:tetratricopeptide repeat protein [Kofleriaceae bacterium]
ARSGVYPLMSPLARRLLCAAVLSLGLAACGGKDKKGAAEPGQTEGGASAGQTGAGAQTGQDGQGEAQRPPGVGPPGLDLTPAEKQKRVAAHLKRGQTALDTSRDPDTAANEARQALAVDETSVDAMVLLAHAHYAKGYYDLVQDVLDKALQRGGGNNKKLHFLLGMVHDRNKKPDEALAAYQKAVAIDPSYKSALMNLGVHQLRSKRFQEAVSLYERLTGQLAYRTPASYTNLGSAYRGMSAEFATSDVNRRNELLLKAERSYKQALATNRNYPNAYYNMGLLYLDADPFPEGRTDMDFIKRLQRAKSQFDEYRRLPGADQKLADEQVSVAQKLIEKEERARLKAREREAKQKARDAKDAQDKAKEEAEKAKGTTPTP